MKNRTISQIPNPTPRSSKRKVIIGIIILAIIISLVWWLWPKSSSEQNNNSESAQLVPSINGVLVNKNLATLRPIAVVIENHTDSRPQSGYSDAEIVYESLAEGGITRTLAVFQTKQPKSIGPVRSARPYFNFLANQWGAAYAHSGGSKQALSELSAGVHNNLYDINEFSYGKFFERDSSRFAPHNLFTNLEDLRTILEEEEEVGWTPVSVWKYGEVIPTEQMVKVNNVTVPFSVANYEASYNFNQTTNSYDRTIGGKAAIDRNNQTQISPKNVLVQFADTSLNPDDELLTINIRLNSSGPCILFTAGIRKDCRWTWENNKTKYSDLDGNELTLQAGQTWIEIFPRDRQNEVISN